MDHEIAVDGIVKCAKNAERLIEAAHILFEKNSIIGTPLAVTAIEEYGKAFMILFHYGGHFQRKFFIREFTSHKTKRGLGSYIALGATLVSEGSRDAYKILRVINKLDFEIMRDGVLYVNYNNGQFIEPTEDIIAAARIFKVALRLRRLFSILSNPDECSELLKNDWNSNVSKKKLKIFDRFMDFATGKGEIK